MEAIDPSSELVPVPLVAVRFPIPLPVPAGFDPERLETWPHVEGDLEFVDERLLYMPPTGDTQQDTCTDVARVLGNWRQGHREFVVGTNAAGVRLGNARTEEALREKADWYLAHGTEVVWLLFPTAPRGVVLSASGEVASQPGERVPAHPALPGLEPLLNELFEQVLETR